MIEKSSKIMITQKASELETYRLLENFTYRLLLRGDALREQCKRNETFKLFQMGGKKTFYNCIFTMISLKLLDIDIPILKTKVRMKKKFFLSLQ